MRAWSGVRALLSLGVLAAGTCGADRATDGSTRDDERLPVSRYERAEAFLPDNLGKLVKGEFVSPNWREDGSAFWFEAEDADGFHYVLIDPDRNLRRPLIDRTAVRAHFSESAGEPPGTIRLANLAYDFETEEVSFDFADQHWSYDPKAKTFAEKEAPPEEPPGLSPDGRWRVFVREHDLHIEEVSSGNVRRLTTDGSVLRPYARPIVNLRRMVDEQTPSHETDPDVAWSPDSRRFASYRMNLEGARRLNVVQSTPPDGAPPVAYDYVYPLAGDEIVPTAEAFVIEAVSGVRTAIDLPAQEILYYYGPSFEWTGDGEEVVQVVPARGYQALRLYATEAATGETRVLTENVSATFVDYYDHAWSHLEETGTFFWLSEISGWHHAYLVERNGERRTVTSGDWRVQYLAGTDSSEDTLFVVGNGREPDRDPYLRHLYRVSRHGGEPVLLTPEPLDHAVSVSPDGRYFVDNMSLIDRSTRSVLRRAQDGTIVMELQQADVSALDATGYRRPEPFRTVAADGKTLIYGAIYRPSDFDPAKRYPIIENIYTGPHYVMTPKSFTAGLTGRNAASIAELGFVVVLIDGRGTSGRSRAFLEPAYRNLHGVGLDDHMAGIHAIAERYPYMDRSRVGIYGFSAGGYDVVRAMTRHPDFYKAGRLSLG